MATGYSKYRRYAGPAPALGKAYLAWIEYQPDVLQIHVWLSSANENLQQSVLESGIQFR